VSPPPLDQLADRHPNRLGLRSGLTVLLLASLSCLCWLGGLVTHLSLYDEGLAVYGAERVLGGEVPYRDFWTLYAPGQFYALAAVFHFCGPGLLAARVYSAAVQLLIVVCAYGLARKLVPAPWALLSWFLVTVTLPAFNPCYPMAPAMLCALLSCFCLARYLEGPKRRYLLMAGACTGVGAVFRHDVGAYIFFAETVLILTYGCRLHHAATGQRAERVWEGFRAWGYYLAGIIWVTFPVGAFFLARVPIADVYADLIQFPIQVYPRVRSLPYPALVPDPAFLRSGVQRPLSYGLACLERVPFYLPLAVYLAAAARLILLLFLRHPFAVRDWLQLLLLLLGLTLFTHARMRADLPHLLPTLIPAILLFSAMGMAWSERPVFRRLLGPLMLLTVLSLALPFLQATAALVHEAPALVLLDLERARGIALDREQAGPLQEAVRYLQERVPAGERIFVASTRHDRIVSNDILFYFLADRPSATRYHELHPGVVDTQAVQRAIIQDLGDQQVRYIVLETGGEEVREPNASGESTGVTELDAYIRAHYRPETAFGPHLILRRAPESPLARGPE
jgi:dolichyl-phosphate-mannose-protein mannosyltransferase